MATAGSFKIGVSVTDSATAGLKKINAQLTAMQKPYTNLSKQVQRFGDLSGISKVTGALKGLGSQALRTVEHIGSVGLSITGLAGIASLGGIAALASRMSDFGNSVKQTGLWLGQTTTQVLTMSNLSRMLGAAPDSLAKSYENVADKARAARLGLDPDSMQLFSTLGITTAAHQTDKAMDQIINKARQLHKEGRDDDVRVLYRAFGLSPDLIKMIDKTTLSYGEMKEQAAEAAKKMAPFTDAMDKVHDSVANLGVQMEATLMMAVGPWVKTWSDWLADPVNQQRIIVGFGQGIHDIGVFITEAMPKLEKMWEDFKAGKGPLNTLVEGLAAVTAISLVAWSAGIVGSLGTILSAAAAIGAIPWLLAAVTAYGLPRVLDMAAHGILGKDGVGKGVSAPQDPRNRSYNPNAQWGDWSDWNPLNWNWTEGSKANRRAASGSATPTVQTEELKKRETDSFNYLTKDLHVPEPQAAGMVASAVRESNIDPYSVSQDGWGMLGIMNWDTSRRAGFVKQFHHAVDDRSIPKEQLLHEQWQYAVAETAEGGAEHTNAQRFLATHDPKVAGGAYSSDVIRPGDRAGEETARGDLAGHIIIDVNHNNPPEGTSVRVKTKGISGPPPSVATSMPNAGSHFLGHA